MQHGLRDLAGLVEPDEPGAEPTAEGAQNGYVGTVQQRGDYDATVAGNETRH